MEDIFEAKRALRKAMALLKKEYLPTILSDLSQSALGCLERSEIFRKADSFAIYHAMRDEVQTAAFIDKWASSKTIYLPVICGENLELHEYSKNTALKPGVFGILEPVPGANVEKPRPDLIVVPGVAFDKQMNRLGRGKGYYDRLLIEPELQDVTRVGLCFNFQLVPQIPVSPGDIRMHYIITDQHFFAGSNQRITIS
ncbi:5-formyltetrahydrofolate cyclo-ligase [Massilibacteroides sp.]|uniref:5-formyltetrahydrofolate cyclo-ligase n=1 Tax=Massilibacteroides sp. TaxID=2034766 RepID=UPI0026358114|nr:5-formyltetrahydrofolate cyclo-ligase [Massilibacteroides sp.]MDD4514390.1 5-formyltetrahydrofolate cyclo-ligase [Massilibacteroides sp.]